MFVVNSIAGITWTYFFYGALLSSYGARAIELVNLLLSFGLKMEPQLCASRLKSF